MGLIEQAARRLEELRQAGVEIPWEAAGVTEEEVRRRAEGQPFTGSPAVAVALERPSTPWVVSAGRAAGAATAEPALCLADRHPPDAEVAIDLHRLQAEGCLVPSMAGSALADEFRSLKHPLLQNAAASSPLDGPPRTWMMVTSVRRGEGRTYCAINLAMSMATEGDAPVLLVDADPERPGLLPRLGLQPQPAPGLFDALADPSLDPCELVLKTDLPGLQLLPAGTRPPHRDDWLVNERLDALLSDLSRDRPERVILLDAPPLSSAHASTLAARVGQVVVVVAAARTALQEVQRAFSSLAQCPLVFPVLNRYREPFEKSARGHSYG